MTEDLVIGIGGRANIRAAGGDYKGAITILNAGIDKFPMEARLWNNRCYFYCKMKDYKRALEDANEMIRKFPNNLKAYYRKGEALLGLKMYKEAELAFNQVLERSRVCKEATDQILEIKVLQVMELGYSRMQAQEALACSANLEEAMHFVKNNQLSCGVYGDEVYHSDDELLYDEDNEEDLYSTDARSRYTDKFMDPSNPRGIQSLWVGNVDDVTEEELRKAFSVYGKIASIYVLEEKRCAFVNFTDAKAAGAAMKALQGKPMGNASLILKYPNNTFGKKTF